MSSDFGLEATVPLDVDCAIEVSLSWEERSVFERFRSAAVVGEPRVL